MARLPLRGFNNNLYAELASTAHDMMIDSALAFAGGMQKKTQRGARGGFTYRGRGFNASTPNEWPQYVTGEFNKAIDVRETSNPLIVRWGTFGVDQSKLNAIEFGDPIRNIIGRRPHQRASIEFLDEANKAMERK